MNSIGGFLEVIDNGTLTSLSGLDSIDASSINDLSIYDNASLTTCAIQSICDYLVSPNGTIEIHDNATGCNSQQEVEEACGIVSVEELSHSDKVLIYPNPTSTSITVELPNTPQKNTFLSIYNLNGQQLITQQITEPQSLIDVSGLKSGVYFVKIVDELKVMVEKLVVQ